MCFLAFPHQYSHNFYFQSYRLLFSHASAEVRGENTPERKVTLTGDRTHNHQVMSSTRSLLSHPGGADRRSINMLQAIQAIAFSPITDRQINVMNDLWRTDNFNHIERTDIIMYSITCIQRPTKGSHKSGLLQQVVFKCKFYSVDFDKGYCIKTVVS